jgi:predicted nuclease of restriction endonuclease-like (RecB) superfamily
MKPVAPQTAAPQLLGDIRQLIETSRANLAATVNSALTLLYWHIGQRIRSEVLQGERATYGGKVVAALARQLEADYGRGFAEKNLRRMVQFAEQYPDEQIVVSLIRHLSWTHVLVLLPLKEPLARDFYAQMCGLERWSVRTLRERVDSMLFERTALSRQPAELIATELDTLRQTGQLTSALVLKDPYVLDFLGLQDRYLEKGLEDAILRELENFLLELGAGFTFVSRQKRIQLDSDDFYIDLLLYNRRLKRLVAIELKLGEFKAEYKGQMELYLRWLAKHEQEPGEAPPLGIILCSGKKQEQIELLELDASGIHVAEYLTTLPPREVLQAKLHEAIARSRARLENRGEEA